LKEFVDSGLPEPDHFKIQAELFDEEKAKSDLQDGGFIVEVKALSVDPFQRATIRSDGKHKSAVKVGEPLNGFVVGNITHSKNSSWKVGDLFGAGLPFVTRQIVTLQDFNRCRNINIMRGPIVFGQERNVVKLSRKKKKQLIYLIKQNHLLHIILQFR
jgi:NADPH-dependent curcumin reductase CurA